MNSIDRSHEPYLISVRAPRDASETAAADAAAHTALVGLYPAQQSIARRRLRDRARQGAGRPRQGQGRPPRRSRSRRDLLAIRADDGSTVVPPPFVPGTNPGDYRPTPPNLPTPVFTTWGQVTPFVLDSGDQFRPAPPPALTSHAYAAAINEVQSLGSATSTTRTADQTADRQVLEPTDPELLEPDRAERRARPPQRPADDGAAVRRAQPEHRRLDDRLLRRQVHLPTLAARHGDPPRRHRRQPATRSVTRTGSRSPATPPADPSYPGAHSTISAAGADVLASFYGDDQRFSVSSPALPGVTRSFGELHGGRAGGRSQPDLRRPAHAARPRRRAQLGDDVARLRPPQRPPAGSRLLRQVAAHKQEGETHENRRVPGARSFASEPNRAARLNWGSRRRDRPRPRPAYDRLDLIRGEVRVRTADLEQCLSRLRQADRSTLCAVERHHRRDRPRPRPALDVCEELGIDAVELRTLDGVQIVDRSDAELAAIREQSSTGEASPSARSLRRSSSATAARTRTSARRNAARRGGARRTGRARVRLLARARSCRGPPRPRPCASRRDGTRTRGGYHARARERARVQRRHRRGGARRARRGRLARAAPRSGTRATRRCSIRQRGAGSAASTRSSTTSRTST